MPVTTYLSADHFQYWRQALDKELLALVDLANERTPRHPWRVRLMLKTARLRWWHWRKTTISKYQLLYTSADDDESYEITNLGNYNFWEDRSLVFAFFVGYNAASAKKE